MITERGSMVWLWPRTWEWKLKGTLADGCQSVSGESMFQNTYTVQGDSNKTREIGSCFVYTATIRIAEIINQVIRTEYALWKLPPANAIQYIVNIYYWHIHHIVVYKNHYWVLHDFLLGGVGRPVYVRRDPPVYVVRFVRYVTLMGDYYTLLRSRSALCLYGFCRVDLQLLGILERDERSF